MPIFMPHDKFLGNYFDHAWNVAEMTIASVIKKNGPIHSAIDVDSVKAEGALAGLERTYENFDANHETGASVKTLLSKIVHNCVLTELGKATTAARRAGLIPPKPKKTDEKKYSQIVPGVKQRPNISGPIEPRQYQESEGWQERKEKLLNKLGKYLLKLPVNDQIILSYWAEDDKTYVEKSLEELGLEKNSITANWVYGRKNKALKALKSMMGGQKPDYRDIYLPSAGRNTNSAYYTDRNELRRHQYAAKAHATKNINYKKTVARLEEKIRDL